MAKLTESTLADIVDTVVKSVDPEQVYVFGSHARGEAGENSDLDLLIVEREGFGPTRSRRREMTRIWRLLAPFRIPKDILVYSVDEVQRWRDGRNHVISHALREGKLLYERP